MKTFSVSVIIPVFNEEEIIESSVNANLQLLKQFQHDFEILIVNDGSTDRSAQIIDRCFSGNPAVRILHKPINEGFGSAIKEGVTHALKEHLLCVPADSPLTQEILLAFADASVKADVVVSYRLKRLGYNLFMKLNSAAFHFLVKNLFDIDLRDFNWIHMYHRKIFKPNSSNGSGITIRSKGLFMLAEVLISAKRKGYSFHEIPVHQTKRITGVATASRFIAVIRTLKEMADYRMNGIN